MKLFKDLTVNSSYMFLTFCFLFYFSIDIAAQVRHDLQVTDRLTNQPISYYSITDGKTWAIGDSLGKTKVPVELLNKTLTLRCLSYPDTIISISDSEILKKIALKSNIMLDEVVIQPTYNIEQKVNTLKNSLKKFNSIVYSYTSAVYKYPIEFGTIYQFDKLIKLKLVSFRANTNYPDNKIPAILHIYTIKENSEPIAKDALLLNKIVPITNNNYFTYDLSDKNIYLYPGQYLISFELMPTNVSGEKISIPFNFTSNSPSKMATSKGKKKWIDTRTGDFTQLISTVEYNIVKIF